jgi:hypothetical protein
VDPRGQPALPGAFSHQSSAQGADSDKNEQMDGSTPMARTTRSTRVLAALGIAILTVTDIGSAAHAAPARMRSATYTAPDGSYSFAYPATWIALTNDYSDVVVEAPDQNVGVASGSIDGTFTNAKAALAGFVKPLGKPTGKAHYGKHRLSDGRSLLEGDTLARMKDGYVGLVSVEFVSTGGRTYWLEGVIEDVHAGSASQDAHQMAQTMASFSVAANPTNQ